MFWLFLFMYVTIASATSTNERFSNWVDEFKIHIETDLHRSNIFENWLSNDKYILETNNKNLTYRLGHNHLSGLNINEYNLYMGFNKELLKDNSIENKLTEVKCLYDCVKNYDKERKLDTLGCVKSCIQEDNVENVPESINWVDKGGVTPVKDQGQCGSCWSFSTTGALEGAYFVKTDTLESFSEQELVDCDSFSNGGRDHGCNGGLMDNAFTWIEKNGGLCSEEDYPYISGTTKKKGTCDTSCQIVDKSKITSFVDVQQNSDQAMMEALSKQPVSIAIQADERDFQLYTSGVFTGTCGTNLDHGVLVVGYDTLDGVDYYLVKNSWSTSWGENGYIKLGRGSEYNNGSGQCGMLMQASYPEV